VEKFKVMSSFLTVLGVIIFICVYLGLVLLAIFVLFGEVQVLLDIYTRQPPDKQLGMILLIVGCLALYSALMFLTLFKILKRWNKYMNKELKEITGYVTPEPPSSWAPPGYKKEKIE